MCNQNLFAEKTQICICTLLLALTTANVNKGDAEKWLEVLTVEVVLEFDSEWSTQYTEAQARL